MWLRAPSQLLCCLIVLCGMFLQPNLRLSNGTNRLGTYEYATDTVTLSSILLDDLVLLDYVMYHELLHKKHQFGAKGSCRQLHHSALFKADEEKFPNHASCEKELALLV